MSYNCWVLLVPFLMLVFDLAHAVENDEGLMKMMTDTSNEYDDFLESRLPTADIASSDDAPKYYYGSVRVDRVDRNDDDYESGIQLRDVFSKRSRLYRKYPGKRQQGGYVNDIYDCNPSSKETIRLLYAIHQARLGDVQHIVFCNRLRNPKGIIPNPRYIGKRTDRTRNYSFEDY